MENSFFCPPPDIKEIVNLICRQKNKSTDQCDLMNIPVLYVKFQPLPGRKKHSLREINIYTRTLELVISVGNL